MTADSADLGAARRLLDVSRETWERLEAYVALLRKWQPAVQLVAPSTLPHVWTRHIADSAQAVTILPDARRWVDLGSGGGFPGLVIAILLRNSPGARVQLIESDSRKAAFLRAAARNLELPADVRAERIEAALASSPEADAVTARALAPLPRLLGWSAPLLRRGATGLFFKGQNVEKELTCESICRNFSIELIPSRTESAARIVLAKALPHV